MALKQKEERRKLINISIRDDDVEGKATVISLKAKNSLRRRNTLLYSVKFEKCFGLLFAESRNPKRNCYADIPGYQLADIILGVHFSTFTFQHNFLAEILFPILRGRTKKRIYHLFDTRLIPTIDGSVIISMNSGH